ncbi:hypothetical protein [Acinetobacter tandoii]|uniref:hypothetical protein n=1 Tax=Acinetobacter tandoii TaxID=202954 RepID=UPI0030199BAC
MSELKLQVAQINEDTVLIVIRGDFTRFSSMEKARRVKDELREFQSRINKPILFIDDSFCFESMNDEQLKQIGLQRIKD